MTINRCKKLGNVLFLQHLAQKTCRMPLHVVDVTKGAVHTFYREENDFVTGLSAIGGQSYIMGF